MKHDQPKSMSDRTKDTVMSGFTTRDENDFSEELLMRMERTTSYEEALAFSGEKNRGQELREQELLTIAGANLPSSRLLRSPSTILSDGDRNLLARMRTRGVANSVPRLGRVNSSQPIMSDYENCTHYDKLIDTRDRRRVSESPF